MRHLKALGLGLTIILIGVTIGVAILMAVYLVYNHPYVGVPIAVLINAYFIGLVVSHV